MEIPNKPPEFHIPHDVFDGCEGCIATGHIIHGQPNSGDQLVHQYECSQPAEIVKEVNNNKLYREFKVDYKNYELDLRDTSEDQNADSLMSKAKNFFKKNGLLLNWKEFAKLDEVQKINTLSMISPITNEEKQKLLEALTIKDKINTLEKIIDFYIHEVNFNNQTVQ